MRALLADRLPSTPSSVVGLLIHRRRGLAESEAMPRIERHVRAARVDDLWLRGYCACTGWSGRATAGLPPLAMQIAAAPLHLAIMADPAFPFRPLGIVHQSQHIRQWADIDPAAAFDLTAHTTDARVERRGVSFGLVTEACIGGARVWRAELRVLSLLRRADEGRPRRSDDEPAEAPRPLTREIVEVAESVGRSYARIAADPNPVHLHAWLARRFGFPRAIAHGTWTLARALASSGLPGTSAYALEARFRRPVELPSRLIVSSWAYGRSDEVDVRVSDLADLRTRLTARVTAGGG